jgi:putative nucleotidyltransferase with HDIG domain
MSETEENKRLVCIIEPNDNHRAQLVRALGSNYDVVDFADGFDAIKAAKSNPPAVILSCEDKGAPAIGQFYMRLRDIPQLQTTPVFHILAQERKFIIKDYKDQGVKYHIFKPYMRSQLFGNISDLLNKSVEEEWTALPELQREALQNSLGVFNGIADALMTGQPVAFTEVKSNCQSLVEAVDNNDFKSILDGVRNHDDYTYAHSMRVATLLTLLGHAAGFKNNDQLLLSSGGLLHDVGKMNIPHNILNKPGRLTEDEFEIMKSHVTETVDYLNKVENIPKAVFIIAEQHHEKLDGTGYPYGLKGKELNELARMAAIVDVFSALTDRRVYKEAMPAEKAMSIMTDEMCGGHLDPHYLKLFKTILFDADVMPK